MIKISTVDARENFAEVINQAAYGKNRVVLTRRGKPLVAVIPLADLEELNALNGVNIKTDFAVSEQQ